MEDISSELQQVKTELDEKFPYSFRCEDHGIFIMSVNEKYCYCYECYHDEHEKELRESLCMSDNHEFVVYNSRR